MDGVCYDLSYDIEAVHHMSQVHQFSSINAKLLQAVELKTQLDNIESSKLRQENPENTARHLTTTVTDQPPCNSSNEFKPKSFD